MAMTTSSGSHELKELRRVAGKGALLLLPFLLLLLAELFVLPIDFFTFRVWEAALAEPYRYPGPFYPNMHVRKEREYGDRYRFDSRSRVEAKPVEWFTDAYGWRNRPEIEQQDKYDVVILGDSNIVGSFLDQKDMISEAIGTRSGKVAYSYSIGHDKISLFFSDPRMARKTPGLLVVESKVGNWLTNNSSPINFRELPDGGLDIVDRSPELKSIYDSARSRFLERMKSRLNKQAMFHWLKASLAASFEMPARQASELFFGGAKMLPDNGEAIWRPFNWFVSSGVLKPLPEERQPALALRAASSSFWKTERFVASHPGGKMLVRFEAKNSVTPSRHRFWIHEDGSYRSVGEFVAGSAWQAFEIPITPNSGSILELQIDQADAWQWLSIRDFRVVGGTSLPVKEGAAVVAVPMAAWVSQGAPCAEMNTDCRQWAVAGRKGYVQTPALPQSGEAGLLLRFEARSDKPATTFTPVYLFEGEKYRAVAQYAFGPEWREFSLLLKPDHTVPAKIQVDYPEAAGSLAIRNFQATPVERLR